MGDGKRDWIENENERGLSFVPSPSINLPSRCSSALSHLAALSFHVLQHNLRFVPFPPECWRPDAAPLEASTTRSSASQKAHLQISWWTRTTAVKL